MNVQRLIDQNPEEFRIFMDENGDLPEWLYKELFYILAEKMPYGTLTADTGDPYLWIYDEILANYWPQEASKE